MLSTVPFNQAQPVPNANLTEPQYMSSRSSVSLPCTKCHIFHAPSKNCPSLATGVQIRLALDDVKALSGGDPAITQQNRAILQGFLKSLKNSRPGETGGLISLQSQQHAQLTQQGQPAQPTPLQPQRQELAQVFTISSESESESGSSESDSEGVGSE